MVAEALHILGQPHGLEADDLRSCSMGANGMDVLMSPAARRVFGVWAIECKNVEKLQVVETFRVHAAKYPQNVPVLVHTKNNSDVLVTMKFSTWLALLKTNANDTGNSDPRAPDDRLPRHQYTS